MFSSKNQSDGRAKKTHHARDHHAVTILTSGCQFVGKFYCKGSTRVAGRLEGQLHSEGFLVIEEDAEVQAEIKAEDTVIQGHVTGKIIATVRVELCPTARVEGDIVTPVLVIKEGAQFNGHTTMTQSTPAVTSKEAKNTSTLGGKGFTKTTKLPPPSDQPKGPPGKTPPAHQGGLSLFNGPDAKVQLSAEDLDHKQPGGQLFGPQINSQGGSHSVGSMGPQIGPTTGSPSLDIKRII